MTLRPTTFYFFGLTLISIATVATNVLLMTERRDAHPSTAAHHRNHQRHRTKRRHRQLGKDGGDPDHRQQLYHQQLLNSRYARYHLEYASNMKNGTNFLKPTDSIYRVDFASPFVLERHRLVFFTVPKAACTVFKQLFRRMQGHTNWHKQNNDLPHKQQFNGLRLLRDYPLDVASEMLTNNTWTRAIFLRDPRERLLSAYLDKGKKPNLINKWCCPETNDCGGVSAKSFKGFLTEVIPRCLNDHWALQSRRMEPKFYYSLNFIGYIETAAEDTRQLLVEMGQRNGNGNGEALWDTYCSSGWGKGKKDHIFQRISSIRHGTSSNDKLKQYYNSPEILRQTAQMLRLDLEHPLFQFSSVGASTKL
mmetsp:Transcript_6113/g.17109  ORF Transcript_6113/g.17109 Transcript_6113/m.17109 type:complete len:363 (+) Transcript_6113:75-1163(+)